MKSKIKTFFTDLQIVFILIAIIWLVEIFNLANGNQLYTYGILPRSLNGLKGILLHPFIHGNLQHIILNTVPLFVLGIFVAIEGRATFLKLTMLIIIFGGGLLWLFGRPSFHIGSSVLIFGYFGFIIANVFYKRTIVSALVSIITLLLYGGLIYGIVPVSGYISWEGHLFGMLAGIYGAGLFAEKS